MNIEQLRPADTPEYMTPAWLGCISWAIGNEDLIAAFREDTGITWKPGHTPIDRMIDEATKCDEHFAEAFVRWVNVNVWGPIDGPVKEVISENRRQA